MLCGNALNLTLRTLVADLEALNERLRDREAMSDPAVLAECARVVRAAIAALGTSQTRLAPLLGVSGDKTVRDWCSARMTPPRTALRALRFMVERLVDPPPEELMLEQDRFASCTAAVRQHLDKLAEHAGAAGWSEQEVAAAIQAWVAGQGAR